MPIKTPPERITGWWNFMSKTLQHEPDLAYKPCAYIRQDIAKELAMALVDICEDASIESLMAVSGLSRERCHDIKELAITYMED